MIYLKLFLSFLQIGAVSFGGGYAMISLIKDKVLIYGWLNETQLLNMIAVSESTPGPIAVNMATFVGSSQAGALGAFLATLGVVLPSFIVILIVAAFIKNILKYKGVQAVLSGIRPCIVALILSTSIILMLSTIFSFKSIASCVAVDKIGLLILIVLIIIKLISKKFFDKKTSPISMIMLSAILGMVLYSI